MTQIEIAIKMVLDRWNGSIENLNKHLSELSDEQLQKDITQGKNSGTYLLGHLIAVHDSMLVLLNMGEKQYPELYEPFIKQADKVATQIPTIAELRTMWAKQNDYLQEKFSKLSIAEWFEKHTAVTAEDFVNEPQRNKLNIIITRTSHLQYHTGQIVLLKK